MTPASHSIRKELVYSTTVLFAASVVVAIAAAAVLLPVIESALAALAAITLIVLAQLVILFYFLRTILIRTVLRPVDEIVEHAERIRGDELEHRIPPQKYAELDRIVSTVNTLAERLIDERKALAANVVSLDETNAELTRATQELVRAARLASVGTLAAGVAHEIGNPLAALRGYMDIIRSRVESGRDVSEILDGTIDEIERIDSIIRHILAFGDTAEAASEQPLTDPTHVLPGILHELSTRHEATLAFETEEVPMIRVHPRILERVVTNLVENAVKTVGPKGEVTVRVRSGLVADRQAPIRRRRGDDPPDVDYSHRRRLSQLLKVQAPPPPDAGPRTFILEVLDRGPGIPEKDLPRLFDPFFTTRGVGQGTGMGLALVARMVGELGGEVEVENRDGGGACFRVHLPGVE
jgi:two-component system, NtrC family, sensor kinase